MPDGPGSGAALRRLSRRELRVYSGGTVEFPLASPTLGQRMLPSPFRTMSFTHAPVMAPAQMRRGMQSWTTAARRLLLVGLAALAMVALEPQAGADSSICSSVFVGDLNNDKKVTALDLQRFGVLRDSGQYDPCADFTRDGLLTDADGFVLTRLIQFATDASTGGGGQFRIPNIQLNEVRLGVDSDTQTQQRYVEFRLPEAPFPASYAWTGELGTGYSLVLVGWDADGGTVRQGVVLGVVELSGLDFQSSGASAGYALVLPEVTNPPQFTLPIGNVVPLRRPLREFFGSASQNVTLLLTYRRPPTAAFSTNVSEPVVGQGLDVGGACRLATRSEGSANELPPWDVILDAVSLRRSDGDTELWGCNYCPRPDYSAGPLSVGTPPEDERPFHAFRCEGSGTSAGQWRAASQAPALGVDTPGSVNRACSDPTTFCGQSGAESCLRPHANPACDDAACCSAVCQVLPDCCESQWDALCVQRAGTECLECGGAGAGDCFTPSALPACDDTECCESVCELDAMCCVMEWDASCVATAETECLSCGDDVGSCFLPHEQPYCADEACCLRTCALDVTCCQVSWDINCVEIATAECAEIGCGSELAGDCCVPHDTPFCSDGPCCALVCSSTPFCCEVTWDEVCTKLAITNCPTVACVCGAPDAESCFEVHELPGCADGYCCLQVCRYDPFCCVVTWDATCVQGADTQCAILPECQGTPLDPVTGSCLIAHLTPGCDDPACCDEVCQVDPECCITSWDLECTVQAGQLCSECGNPNSGSCFSEHNQPSCLNAKCCESVCAQDPFCCEDVWDSLCVDIALDQCADPTKSCGQSTLRPCFVPSVVPGCNQSSCCDEICGGFDAFCCEVAWDALCVQLAVRLCTPPGGSTGGSGDCLEVHPTRGCGNDACAATVCSVEPNCCQISWDQRCVAIAATICVTPNACPGNGECFVAHNSGGCSDPYCCNAVCGVDPSCCNERWDSSCVTAARELCEPQEPEWNCPCLGSCFEAHPENPGCEQVACCSAVCAEQPTCCIDAWDQNCANLAQQICCGGLGCDSGCAGPCLESHDSPYCDEPYCCEAVCQVEPFCCEVVWDGACATIAQDRCARGCGSALASSCFFDDSGSPGCNDFECCATVCEQDSYCCEFDWDVACVELARSFCEVPKCGDEQLGDCCVPHEEPWCREGACCDAVCAQDTFCCEFEWDVNCVELTYAISSCSCAKECGDECAGSCCEPHLGVACQDEACCKDVCAQDMMCCTLEWDQVCADLAKSLCYKDDGPCPLTCGEPSAGSCCIPHPSRGCDDLACCTAVCDKDTYCCLVEWDQTCVALVGTECREDLCSGLSCGSPDAGSCYSEHPEPYCDDFRCCDYICSQLALCCELEWDAECVKYAVSFCTGFTGDAPGGSKGRQQRRDTGVKSVPRSSNGQGPSGAAPPTAVKPGKPAK